MKKKLAYTAIALLALLYSCGEQTEHHFIVVHNNYKDTTEVVAKYWRTENKHRSWELPDGVNSVTEFYGDNGTSSFYNVDCIIAKDSTNNN